MMDTKVRLHGQAPYKVVAVHGGPGAVGQAQPFAGVLAARYGVVEPFLLAETFGGQLNNLKTAIERYAEAPVVLVGHSYGALISFVLTAKYPELVRKLIMVSSGLLEAKGVPGINETRASRLSPAENEALESARAQYKQATGKAKERAFVTLFTQIQQADAYDPLPHQSDLEVIRPELYDSAWEGMQALRDSGQLVELGKNIRCPVAAIHGDYDPRPAASVRRSLQKHITNLRFVSLKQCGHYPWYERQASATFYQELFTAIK